MTALRTAAQQALEALDGVLDSYGEPLDLLSISGGAYEALQCREAITALRAALAEHFCDTHCTWADHAPGCVRAEPVQEPVAWRWGYRSVTTGEMDWRGYVEIAADPNLRSPAIIMQPLYTAPPQQALTIERLRDALVASRIIQPAAVEDPDEYDDGVTLFRIEALHRRIT